MSHQTLIMLGTILLAIASHRTADDCLATESNAAALRPNIIYIMADDMNDGCCCGEEIAGENHCFSPSSEMN